MKIIGIDESPRNNGNTEKLLKKVLAGRVQATGTRGKDDILSRETILAGAHSFGRNLVA